MNSGEDGAGHMSCRSSDPQPSESVKVAGSGRHDPAGEDGQALLHHYHLSAVKSSGGPSGFWISIKCSDSSSPNKNRGFGPKSRKADDKKQQSSSTLPNHGQARRNSPNPDLKGERNWPGCAAALWWLSGRRWMNFGGDSPIRKYPRSLHFRSSSMDTKLRSVIIPAALYLVLIGTQFPKSTAFVANQGFNPPYSKAISDLKEAIVKGLGFQADDFKISGFDLRDAQVGRSVAYEFDVEIDNKVLPLKLLEDVNRWEYVDLPIFQREHLDKQGKENGLLPKRQFDDQMPVLAPFQLAGPMELWIQDADDMRISLPHDVDAGVLKKVIVADGAVVTVKGAKSVSLRHPIELPLPLNRTNNGFASGLLTLAEFLQDAARSQDGPLLSLRIVGPTSITSPAPSSPSSNNNRLKLKRLAPGLVELSSASKKRTNAISAVDLQGEATTLLSPDRFSALWPIVSVNGSNPNLLGFEALLSSVLGPRAKKGGSFRVLKADVSAQTFVKIGFEAEKKVKESEIEGFPEWRTKPSMVTMHFEVLAKVDGNKVVPERVIQVEPVMAEDSIAPSVIAGNVTMSTVPVVHLPPSPFTL